MGRSAAGEGNGQDRKKTRTEDCVSGNKNFKETIVMSVRCLGQMSYFEKHVKMN